MTEKNNSFFNGLWRWFPIIILITGGFMASNRIDSTALELKDCIDQKVDKTLYDQEIKTRDEQYNRILKKLDQIEQKIDGRIKANSNRPGIPGD